MIQEDYTSMLKPGSSQGKWLRLFLGSTESCCLWTNEKLLQKRQHVQSSGIDNFHSREYNLR